MTDPAIDVLDDLDAPPPPPPPPGPGDRIGELALLDRLGEGRFGEVWTVRRWGEPDDRATTRRVLVRIGRDRGWVESLARDVLLLRGPRHPGVAAIHEVHPHEVWPYAIVERAAGAPLAGGPLPWTEARAIAVQVAEALAALHARGLAHGALGPQNVLLDAEGRVTLTDAGLLRHAPAALRGAGEPPSVAADVHALGGLIYRMLTGQAPRGAWRPLAERGARGVPGPIEDLVRSALDPFPGRRPADAGAVLRALAVTAPVASPRVGRDRRRQAGTFSPRARLDAVARAAGGVPGVWAERDGGSGLALGHDPGVDRRVLLTAGIVAASGLAFFFLLADLPSTARGLGGVLFVLGVTALLGAEHGLSLAVGRLTRVLTIDVLGRARRGWGRARSMDRLASVDVGLCDVDEDGANVCIDLRWPDEIVRLRGGRRLPLDQIALHRRAIRDLGDALAHVGGAHVALNDHLGGPQHARL